MELNQLLPGSPVEFSIKNAGENPKTDSDQENNTVYISSIFTISKKGELIIHIPTRQGHLVTLPMNIEYNFVVNTNAGLFSLTGLISNKGKLEEFPVYIISPTSKITKVQRRDYYRYDCMIPVKVHPIPREIGILPTNELIEKSLSERASYNGYNDVVGTIMDISGGGARFHSALDVDTDTYMVLSFVLPTKNEIPMKVVARRVKSEYKEEHGMYEHRVEFVFKEQDDREVIIRFIFDEERRLRKKNQG